MQHIRACLPELRTRVNSLLSKNQQILTSLGGPVEKKVWLVMLIMGLIYMRVDHAQGSALLQVIISFSTAYTQTIDGTSRNIETAKV